jgi:5-methylcytosine-specific restriction endonuclease McrA
MARRDTKLPSRSEIVTAWAHYHRDNTLPWREDDFMDWGEPECWACRYYSESWPDGSYKAWDKAAGLQRCHVIPQALGGSDEPLNLVILCEPCHADSPDHVDPSHMYEWMRAQPKRFMGTWHPDHIAELQRIMETALASMTEAEVMQQAGDVVSRFMAGANTHFGKTSDGTRAALLKATAIKLGVNEP